MIYYRTLNTAVLNTQQKIPEIYNFYNKYVLRPPELMSLMRNDDEQEEERWKRIPYEIECKGEIECYDKISELHPEYPVIIYNYARKYKKRLKKIAISKTKVKSLKKRNINIVSIGILFACLFISLT